MNAKGYVGTASYGGFQDISVRDLSCEKARPMILDVAKTLKGAKVEPTFEGYECAVIETFKGGLHTVRCATSDRAFRFTVVPAHAKEITTECGTFGRFYDVTAHKQGCEQVATFLDNTNVNKFTAIPVGKTAKIGTQTCKALYAEKHNKKIHKTIHCDQGDKAMRFSIAEKASTKHPPHYAGKPTDGGKPNGGKHPNVITSCNAVGAFNAITARGITCGAVGSILRSNASQIKSLKPGASIRAAGYTCERIDRGAETATVQCLSTGGASFRASYFKAAPGPGPVVPPATVAPAPVKPKPTEAATTDPAQPTDEPTDIDADGGADSDTSNG